MAKVNPPKGVTTAPAPVAEATPPVSSPEVAPEAAPPVPATPEAAAAQSLVVAAQSAESQVSGGLAALAEAADADNSMEGMRQFMIVPRLKIVQGQSDGELKKQFGEGAVIINPGAALVAEKEAPFHFVPLFYFSEYALWSDRRDKESKAIIERSFDANSIIAKNAADKAKREVLYPGHEKKPDKEKWYKRYVHHFCFPGIIYGDNGLAGTPVVLSFERGEWTNGRQFVSSIQMKKFQLPNGTRKTLPLWAQVWQLQSAPRLGELGNWWGYEPRFVGRIADAEVNPFRAQHLEFARLHEEKLLQVDHGNEGQGGTGGETEAEVAARVEQAGEM
jgi:hypothetical protein